MNTQYFPTQLTTFLAALFFLGVTIHWVSCNRKDWRLALPPMLYFIHAVILYGLYIIAGLKGMYLSGLLGIDHLSENWSAVLRFQGIATIGLYLPSVTIIKKCKGQ